MKKFVYSKKEYIILLFVTILICLPFFTSSKYIEGDDTNYHMSNIYATYTKINSGDLGNNKVLPIIGNDYGYGSGIFYPQLSHIIPAGLTYILQGNIVLAVKIVHFIVYYISAILMFKLVDKVFKNKYVALLSAIFYITFPYAISDVFTRDAFAESFIFMFMPMVMLGVYELFEGSKRKFFWLFIIGYVGLFNSHLVMTMYFTFFVIIYLLVNRKKVFTLSRFASLATASIIVLLLTLPFTISLIEHRFLGEYYVFEGPTIAPKGIVRSATFFPWELFIQRSVKRYSTVRQYFNLLAFALMIVTVKRRKEIIKNETEDKFYKFLWFSTILALVMLTAFPWELMPKFLLMIQFAWRIETVIVFSMSILAALALRNINTKKLKNACFAIIIVYNMITVSYSYMPKLFINYDINEVDMSHYGMGWEKEYLPYRTTQNIDYFNNRGNSVLVRKGEADIIDLHSDTPKLDFKVINNDGSIVIELPRIYYIGYNIEFINENNETQELKFYMNENGFIETRVTGNGTVKVTYPGSAIEKVANKITLGTIVVLAIYIVIDRIKYILFKHKNTIRTKLLPKGEK